MPMLNQCFKVTLDNKANVKLCRRWEERWKIMMFKIYIENNISNKPSVQRESNDPEEVVIESKDNHRMSSSGTIWWSMDDLGERVEYDCIISFEVKLIGERWTIYSEGIKEDLLWR